MAIHFTVAKRGALPSEGGEERILRPRLKQDQTVNAVEFQKKVPWGTAMTSSNLVFALGELQRIMLHEFRLGNAVTLPGIGTFRLSLKGDVEVVNGQYQGRDVRVEGVLFQADRELAKAVSAIPVDQCPIGMLVTADEQEVEHRLTALFRKHEAITHKQVYYAFEGALTTHRVTTLLGRLTREGRLLREGVGSQTRYRAARGQFGCAD